MEKVIDPPGAEQSIGDLAAKIVKKAADKVKPGNGEREYKGGKISEAGLYRKVPMSVYHSDCCTGPSISSSGLRQLTPPNGAPLKYWDASYLNPNRAPEEEKEHFSIGRAVHTLLLSEDGFRDDYAIRPEKWTDWRTNDAKAWRDAQSAGGKTVLVPSDLVDIEGMAEVIAKDRTFVDLLQGRIERSIVWRDEKTGVWLKSRPDSIPADGFIADLKTTQDASEIGCQRATLSYGYHMQMALAVMGLEAVSKQQITDHVLLFIEGKRPYAYNIKPIDPQLIYLGMRQCRAAIDVFADCWKRQEWPTYYGSGQTLSSPDWFDKQIEREPSIPKEAA
ncbi:PD-(D/E)XK nuclease-like domain-containing protein [Pararhizobium sp.]|uniref:PD-(D/E)XK nuclease-like domain-containing protein n=1 Tax=Pararhizobium sp. TaxID=1977563 RepID=UPI002728DBE9|nr:PD-(D/E)XK nuclease-like domain-containing protein [Pararhizobium sp.]MDO9416988.1 PD-(D/E)XK nuclease-like domain-containing protein [Pararhizobium sp.]